MHGHKILMLPLRADDSVLRCLPYASDARAYRAARSFYCLFSRAAILLAFSRFAGFRLRCHIDASHFMMPRFAVYCRSACVLFVAATLYGDAPKTLMHTHERFAPLRCADV